jgi:hypothetical protein
MYQHWEQYFLQLKIVYFEFYLIIQEIGIYVPLFSIGNILEYVEFIEFQLR